MFVCLLKSQADRNFDMRFRFATNVSIQFQISYNFPDIKSARILLFSLSSISCVSRKYTSSSRNAFILCNINFVIIIYLRDRSYMQLDDYGYFVHKIEPRYERKKLKKIFLSLSHFDDMKLGEKEMKLLHAYLLFTTIGTRAYLFGIVCVCVWHS